MIKIPWKIVFPGWTFLIIIAVLFPGQHLPETDNVLGILRPDLVAHFILFLFFALFLAGFIIIYQDNNLNLKNILAIIIIGIVFGALTEFLQLILPVHRNACFLDLVMNSSGTIIGLLLFVVSYKMRVIG